MAIETTCLGCGRRLKVADEHAGKHARCPICQAISPVPLTGATLAAAPVEHTVTGVSATGDWELRTPEGKIYGPVAREELDRWVAEGRVASDCWLRQSGERNWFSAGEEYPTLRNESPSGTPSDRSPAAADSPFARQTPRPLQPHRGVLILVLGILGWLMCPMFAVVAWVVGSRDLHAMRSGHMDPQGAGLTQAGQVLGMIMSVLLLIGMVLLLLILLLGFVGGFA